MKNNTPHCCFHRKAAQELELKKWRLVVSSRLKSTVTKTRCSRFEARVCCLIKMLPREEAV